MKDPSFYIILPVVLFFLNLVIMLVLRRKDSVNNALTNIRRLTEGFRNDTESSMKQFKADMDEIETRVQRDESEVKNLLNSAAAEIGNIRTYNEDLSSLRHSMDTYREALAALARLTSDADAKVGSISEDVTRLEAVENKIKTFQLELQDAEEYFNKHENAVIRLQKDTVGQLEKSVASFKVAADEILKESKDTILLYNKELDRKADALYKARQDLDSSAEKLLSAIGDRAQDEAVLAAEIRSLTKTKEELSRTISGINAEIEEKRLFSDQLDGMNRAENIRLNRLKESVKQYQNTISLFENQASKAREVVLDSKTEPAAEAMFEIPSSKESPALDVDRVPESGKLSAVESAGSAGDAVLSSLTEETPQQEDRFGIRGNNGENTIIIGDSKNSRLEYYGQEEEIVF